ncbi:MAG: hypothetical protein R3C49_01375 [Planctomycetaceae bacterium]
MALIWSATVHSPTIDESGHLPSGISHWHLGRFEGYAVNPPLVRMIAAAPVVLMNPQTDWTPFRRLDLKVSDRVEWELARRFIELNGARSLTMWTVARLTLIPILLMGAFAVWSLGKTHGQPSAILALFLFCSSPDILGHGSLMTPDACAHHSSPLPYTLF